MEDIHMTKEDFQILEDKVETLRKLADEAAEALANDPTDEVLQQKADSAEGALNDAETELGSAEVEDEDQEEEHIDFEEELNKLNGNPSNPTPTPANDELNKAKKALFHNAKRLKDLGGDPATILSELHIPAPTPTPVPEKPEVPTNNVTKEDLVEMEFSKLAKSPAEQKVYMHHYRNSIKQTGNMAEDIQNAMLIANKGRILRSFSELNRANNTIPKPANGNGAPLNKPRVPQINSGEESVLRRRGFKKQADGSWKAKKYTLAINPKTGKWEQTENI